MFSLVGFLFLQASLAQSERENIFNGKSLDNWGRIGEDNHFVVRDGVLIDKVSYRSIKIRELNYDE